MDDQILLAGIASLLTWAYLGLFHWRFWRSDQMLPVIKGKVKKWPAVVAIIPARNEAEFLGRSLQSVADQDYPGKFRVVLVNDGSSDNTAGVAAAVKARAPVQVLNAKPLKDGWAGKLWAMNTGVEWVEKKFRQADFIWFTDADIIHERDVLRELVEAAILDRRNIVSQMVILNCKSFWEKAFVPAFIFFFEMLYPFEAANSDKSRHSGAAGGCLLLQQSWLKKIGGLKSLRTELIDDCAMAKAVKGAGGRIWLGFGLKSRSIRPYTFSDFWTTVARTAFTQLKYSWILLLVTVFGLGILFLLPLHMFLSGLIGGVPDIAVVGGCAWLAMVVLFAPTLRLYKLNPGYGLLLPGIALLYMAMTVHSAFRHLFGEGNKWKQRSYNFKN